MSELEKEMDSRFEAFKKKIAKDGGRPPDQVEARFWKLGFTEGLDYGLHWSKKQARDTFKSCLEFPKK